MDIQKKYSQTSDSLPGFFSLLQEAWKIYRDKINDLLLITAVPFLAVFISLAILFLFGIGLITLGSFDFAKAFLLLPSLGPGLSLLILLLLTICMIATIWSEIALIQILVKRDQGIGLKEAFLSVKSKIISAFWISILVGWAILGGILLFIIPGIIFSVWFVFSSFVLVSEGLSGTKALSKSKALVRGRWFSVFFKIIAFIILIIGLSILMDMVKETLNLPPVSENIFTWLLAPFSTAYYLLIYESLKKIKGEAI